MAVYVAGRVVQLLDMQWVRERGEIFLIAIGKLCDKIVERGGHWSMFQNFLYAILYRKNIFTRRRAQSIRLE